MGSNNSTSKAPGAVTPMRPTPLKDWGECTQLPIVKDISELHAFLTPKKQLGARFCVVFEPWQDVGTNAAAEGVRASVNVAHAATEAGLHSACVPLWQCGYSAFPAGDLGSELRKEGHPPVVYVFEGGAPDAFDPETFAKSTAPRSYLKDVYHTVLTAPRGSARSHPGTGCIFICLSHQMVAFTLVEEVRRAAEALQKSDLPAARELAQEVVATGRALQVRKMRVSAVTKGAQEDGPGELWVEVTEGLGWEHPHFAVSLNEVPEAESKRLQCTDIQAIRRQMMASRGAGDEKVQRERAALEKCLGAQQRYAAAHGKDERDAIQKTVRNNSAGAKHQFHVSMFHSGEVNAEAMLFVHWALERIAGFVTTEDSKALFASTWLKNLPTGLQIVGSTFFKKSVDDGEYLTEVAAMRVDYAGAERHGKLFSHYSCQFHPELPRSLRDARVEFGEANFEEDGHLLLLNMMKQLLEYSKSG